MNIQLRDSKPLQEAIKKNFARKDLPRAQLHPTLLNGIVDADREGFDIRSEFLTGEQKGDPNPQDVAALNHFITGAAQCKATWKIATLKQGDSFDVIPSELIFSFPDGSKLAVHTQSVGDVGKLTNALPSDQSADFTATPSTGRISFKRVGAPLPAAVVGPTIIAELQVQAAKLGVPWDKDASAETMVERITVAREAKSEKKKLQPA